MMQDFYSLEINLAIIIEKLYQFKRALLKRVGGTPVRGPLFDTQLFELSRKLKRA